MISPKIDLSVHEKAKQNFSRPDGENRKLHSWQETRAINKMATVATPGIQNYIDGDKEESNNNAQNPNTTNKLANGNATGGDAQEKITSGTVHTTDIEVDPVKVEFMQKVHKKEFQNIRTSNNVVIVVDTEPQSSRVIFRENAPGKGNVDRASDQFLDLYQSISDQLSIDNTIHVLTQIPNCTIQTLNKALLNANADESVLVKNCLNDDFKKVFYGSKHDVKNAITAFLKTSLIQQNVDDVGERNMAHEQKRPNARTVETSEDTQFEGTIGDITVCVHEGDITRQMVDVVVNAANNRLDHKGGVALAISNAGGRRIQGESRDYVKSQGSLYIGQAMHTGAGNMPCKHVIHTVGPMWDSHSDRETVHVKKQLRKTLTNVLQYASNTLQATSIAIPAISAGIYGVPVDVCAKQLMLATLTFAQSPSHNNTLRHIKFINIDDQVNRAFVRVFSGCLPPNYDVAQPFEHISSKDCPICMDKAIDPRQLDCCGNEFCSKCIKTAFRVKSICPTCGHQYEALKGDQPKGGTMEVWESSQFLPGYPECGSLQIHYHLPSGTQEHCHPNPGRPYTGTDRHAYLPDNKEGREILQLLKTAFDNRLVFTVGTSVSTGQTDVVTWNDIHHKSSIDGSYGYPDPDYLRRVREELAAKGIR
ncbi:uncharacterized protein [Branchiostoma lanceolatum]|uniref:uncharacterized protein n=1 Tax=Branchiostoma lanceolatum TaxID=7740 RepID=UPI003454245C